MTRRIDPAPAGQCSRDEVVRALNPEVLGEAVRELESDDVVDLLEDLDDEQKQAILAALDEGFAAL